jgi:dolichol-phosphate mannosyltransferase
MDGDLQHPPALIEDLYTRARNDKLDLVVASRYLRPGRVGSFSRVRSCVSRLSTTAAKLFFPRALRGLSDPMSGFFLIRRAAVELDSLKPHGFKILLELLVRGRRLTTCEVSYEFGVRHAGESKASLREGLRYLRHLLRLRIDGRLLRFVEFGLVGASGIAVNTAVLALLTEAVGLHYMVSAIVSTQVATVWNFVLTDRWVFKTRRVGASWLARLSAFSFMNNVALALGGPLLFLLVSGLGVQYLLANVVSLLALAIARFVAADSLIWRGSTAGAAVEEASPDAAKPGSWLLPRARRLAFAHAPDDRS